MSKDTTRDELIKQLRQYQERGWANPDAIPELYTNEQLAEAIVRIEQDIAAHFQKLRSALGETQARAPVSWQDKLRQYAKAHPVKPRNREQFRDHNQPDFYTGITLTGDFDFRRGFGGRNWSAS